MLRRLIIAIVGLVIIVAVGVVLMQAPTTWQAGEVARTPEERFTSISDYPFAPHYAEVGGYRIHYVDEGPRDAPPILLMHGEPSWSYLYRKMIPILTDAGYRVIAPDLVGFGKSDKPLKRSDYSYQMHIDTMTGLVRQLELNGTTIFVQDWGGLVGLRVVAEEPERFRAIVAGNTGLPAAGGILGWVGYPLFKFALWREGKVTREELQAEPGFVKWAAYSQTAETLNVGEIVSGATVRTLSPEEIAAYDAPFPDESYKAGARVFPVLVPSQLRQNERAFRDVFEKWEKPFVLAFSDSDPITRGGEKVFLERVPGTKNQPHVTIVGAGHFLQEDQPEILSKTIITAAGGPRTQAGVLDPKADE